MKKILFTLGVLSISYSQAQQNGKVGINAKEAEATLDIKAYKTDGTTREGLLIPRIGKTGLSKIESPKTSTLIFVNEVANYTKGSDPDANIRVAKVNEVGFYHFDGEQWIKHNDEWIYDTETKRINLKRSGKNNFVPKVFYDEQGGYRVTDTETVNAYHYEGARLVPNINTETGTSGYNKTYINSKNIKSITGSSNKILSSINFIADPKGTENQVLYKTTGSIGTDANDTASHGEFFALSENVKIDGTGSIKKAVALRGTTYVGRSAVEGSASGSEIRTFIGGDKNIKLALGSHTRIEALKNASSTIEKAIANYTRISLDETSSVTIPDLVGYSIEPSIRGNTNITNFYGFKHEGLTPNTNTLLGTLQNNYGIYLNDIAGGNTSNYAIYTNKGKVHLGDEVEIKSTIKVADNTTDNTCTTEKAGTIRFVAMEKKFQGCTGDNWVDLHN